MYPFGKRVHASPKREEVINVVKVDISEFLLLPYDSSEL